MYCFNHLQHIRKQVTRKYYATWGLLLIGVHIAIAQAGFRISGTVTDNTGNAAIGATVKLDNRITTTDENGVYEFQDVPGGSYLLTVAHIGSILLERQVTVNRQLTENFNLEEDIAYIDEVEVFGRTKVEEVNRQSYNVTAIKATALHNSTLDLSHALDRVSGIRVRETGGVGSNFNFSLNGFSGNRVKFFIDGIPMDNFGSSFQINNIPINLAERIEVYKGVVPIWLGSDALGGAVNIVTASNTKSYLDVSYSYGSFNTHRSVINAGYTARNGFTIQVNAFQNYSDNDYRVQLDVADINTGQYYPGQTVRRFHDQYHNETIIANVGVVNRPFADRLMLGIALGRNYKEIQTGARMVSTFGAWHRRGTLLMPTLKYQKKDLLVTGLDVTVNANYNFGKEQNIDTLFRRYDWFGNYKEFNGNGGERSRSLYKYGNNNGLVTATFNYAPTERHAFTLNNVFSTFDRKGFDRTRPQSEEYAQPQLTNKNVLGVGYKYDPNPHWSVSLFGKFISQYAKTGRLFSPTGDWNDEYYREEVKRTSKPGYGAAVSYFFNPNLQLKASYERSNRLPENEDFFGDYENLESNFDLKPESSDNANLGIMYDFSVNRHHRFSLSGNAIYRYATDYIFYVLNNNQSKLVAQNLEGVSNLGGDAEVRYSYKNRLTLGANLTYQNILNRQKYEPNYTGVSPVYKDRMPNIPFLFGNADASVFFNNFVKAGNTLSIGYNLLYVHAFYLYWPSRGSGKFDVPRQLAHDANIVYTLQDGRYNIALECKNLTDALLYDNYSLQKPSRGFYLKFRYFITALH